MMKIEKGVPLPPKRKREATYPFANMAVGDSFLMPDFIVNATSIACTYARRGGFKVATRKTRDGVRVWRIA
jgi:hypothetical protein